MGFAAIWPIVFNDVTCVRPETGDVRPETWDMRHETRRPEPRDAVGTFLSLCVPSVHQVFGVGVAHTLFRAAPPTFYN